MGSITEWIVKLQKSKFARRFQYEPYIIKSVEYVNPKRGEKILVAYREVDYFKSLAVQMMNEEDYFSWDVELPFKEFDGVEFDKIVFFVSCYYTTKQAINRVVSLKKRDGIVYCVCFLGGNKFFETTLKLTDKIAYKKLGKELEMFEGLEIVEEKEFKSAHIKVVKLK